MRSFELRPYQKEAEVSVYEAWQQGKKVVGLVLPTGAGKTVVFSKFISDHDGYAVAIAHRQELVMQISLALATWKVPHGILAPTNVIKAIVNKQMRELGRSWFSPNSRKVVAGVDTLLARKQNLKGFFERVTLFVQDEAHHMTRGNKWGKVCDMMPNAKGLGVTATMVRADGKGLGRHAHGLMDHMIVGPTMRHMINEGWLTDYKALTIPNDVRLEGVPVSPSTGDYSKNKLSLVVRESHIVGDVVETYKKNAMGKLGVTFVTDVDTGLRVASKFSQSGVPAECVSHKTDDRTRDTLLQKFARREILQLVNVDLFGEGFDLPAIEVVSMARPTQSYALYAQQFGRALRLLLPEGVDMSTKEKRLQAIANSTKPRALILDHVGNMLRLGLPDYRDSWTLDARQVRTKGEPKIETPVQVCPQCTGTYQKTLEQCPYCGHKPTPATRRAPKAVDGDLMELDEETIKYLIERERNVTDKTLAELRAECEAKNMPELGIRRQLKYHRKHKITHRALSCLIDYYLDQYSDPKEAQKRFYWQFGTDVLTAKGFSKQDMVTLAERIITCMY